MKHLPSLKNVVIIFMLLALNSICKGQSPHAPWTEKSAKAWFKERVWANRLKLNVHEPFNVVEFAKQYEANKATWDKVIDFLRDRNLDLMPPGKYPIDGEKAYATISEGEAKKLDTAGFERHNKFIDLHYVIKGREKIYTPGKNDSLASVKPYDEATDVENFYVKGRYSIATPDEFFLFFPGEIHETNIAVNKGDKVKKLVIKIRAAN